MITGCAQKTTISDANNYLLIQQQLIKMESYRDQMVSCKEDLICVPDAYTPGLTEPPTPNYIALKKYLSENDCTKLEGRGKDTCYAETRLKLIQLNEEYDKINLDNFILNRSIDRFRETISKIIDNFPKVEHLK